jgi:translocation and assembly module TamB
VTPTRTRVSKIAQWGLAALGSFVLLAVFGVWLLAQSVNQPWVKSKLVALVKDEAGLDIDYSELEIAFASGVRARSLRVLSPPRFEHEAPELLRLDGLELQVNVWSFVFGPREIAAVRVGSAEVSIVSDGAGHTSLTELFPAPASPERARLSQSLADLPHVSVKELDIGALRGRMIEVAAGRSPRVTTLSGLSVRGALQSGARGLTGTELHLVGAPNLHLELSADERVQHADIGFALEVRARDAESLAIVLRSSLGEQNVVAPLAQVAELLRIDATLQLDAAAGKTSLSVSSLRALDGAISGAVEAQLFDIERLRARVSGKLAAHLDALPVPVAGLALSSIDLDLSTQELAWEGDRVAGALAARGRVVGLDWAGPDASVSVPELTLLGDGQLQASPGSFQVTLRAPNIAAHWPGSSIKANAAALELHGQARDQAGEQRIDAEAVLALGSAHLAGPASSRAELTDAHWRTRLSGSALELATLALARLESHLEVAQLTLAQNRQQARFDTVSATCNIKDLARAAATTLGVSGAMQLGVSLPSVQVFDGRQRWSLRGSQLDATLPLSLSSATAQLSLASLAGPETSGGPLALNVVLQAPLSWAPDGPGDAQLEARGQLGRFRVGDSRGTLDGLRLLARKLDRDRYRLELDVTGASLVALGVPIAGGIVTQLRADGALGPGTLAVTTQLRGTGGAAVDLELEGQFERRSERLVYRAGLTAEKLEAFSALLPKSAARGAKGMLPAARLSASARGNFSGVLRQTTGPLPALTAAPLASARGSQSVQLELRDLDYHDTDSSIVVPALAIQVESLHRANGAGRATASISSGSVEISGAGESLRLSGLHQKLVATFAQSPALGVMDVTSTLELASASQSVFPEYRAIDLRLSSNLQVERLRSVFIRDLVLDNPASGTHLQASGALERALGSIPGGDTTITGREALSIEGKLSQELGPFVQAGLAARASGSVEVPFRLESGGLLGYRFLAKIECKQVSFANRDGSLVIEDLRGMVPVLEEFALLPSGPVLSPGPRASPLSETRFFDVHPFLAGDDYLTAGAIRFRGETLGPLAANLRVDRTDFAIDQLQAGYRGGQIVGQVRAAWRAGDPLLRLRLNVTGLRSKKSGGVLDANAALSFVPASLTLDGKVQVVRASREHLREMLDLLDPFHEMMNANRVRQALQLGYPKFVRFSLRDGAVDAKVELGGLAKLVRIDEIKAVPLGPILQKYVAPMLSGLIENRSEKAARIAATAPPAAHEEASGDAAREVENVRP